MTFEQIRKGNKLSERIKDSEEQISTIQRYRKKRIEVGFYDNNYSGEFLCSSIAVPRDCQEKILNILQRCFEKRREKDLKDLDLL